MEELYREFVEKHEKELNELQQFIDAAEEKEGSLISVLHKAQHIFGYLPKELQLFIAQKLGISAAKVYGVVSFYSFFTMEPKGEFNIDVCLGTACYVRGADKVLEAIQKKIDLEPGKTSKDGKYSLNCLRCVGACGLAPVIMINGHVYGKVQPSEVEGILNNLSNK